MKWISFFYVVLYSMPLDCVRISSHCPLEHCLCSSSSWSCTIEIGQEQINCGSLPNLSQSIVVKLELVNLNRNRTTSLFANVDNCHIRKLLVSTNIIPWNNLIGNLNRLEYFIIQGKPVDHSYYFNNNLYNLLSGLDQLKRLKIENLLIPDWYQNILFSCHSVEEIELKDLKLKDMELNSFMNCRNLIKLTISFNLIPNIFTSVFQGLLNLNHLTLSGNEIVKINKDRNGWWVVRNLKKLDLSDNFLSKLEPKQFIGLTELEQLILTNNHIEFIDETAFEGLNSLTTLNLNGNKKLFLFDLLTLNPVATSLTMLTIDVQIIQCVRGKSKLFQFHNQIQSVLNLPRDCNGLSQTMVSKVPFSTKSTPLEGNVKSANFRLIIVLTVFITMFISGTLFFIYYYCSIKKKLRNCTNSTTGVMTIHSGSSKYFQGSDLSPLNNTIEGLTDHSTHAFGTNLLKPRCSSFPNLRP